MNYRKNTFTLLVVGALLTGCGGGGVDISGSTGGSTGGSDTTTTLGSLTVAACSTPDKASCDNLSSIPTDKMAYLLVRLYDKNNSPVSGQAVYLEASKGTIKPSSGKLTDSNGYAVFSIQSSDASDSGELSTLTFTSDNTETTIKQIPFGEQFDLALNLVSDKTTLPQGSTAALTMHVTLNGSPYTTPIAIALSSRCQALGSAVLSTTVSTDTTGQAIATYKGVSADGTTACGAPDTITATLPTVTSTTIQQSLSIDNILAPANTVIAETPEPEFITLKGYNSSSSRISFTVKNSEGTVVPSEQVNFAFALPDAVKSGYSISPSTASTDENGQVTITINAGSVPIPVAVKASLVNNPAIQTVSKTLGVGTGYPDSDSFDFAADVYSIEGRNTNNKYSTITLNLSDRFNNPVPDGTKIYLTTEGGSIKGNFTDGTIGSTPTCVTSDSKCTATLTITNPRPSNGRVTVLAYTEGEESFSDLNGNGILDEGDFIASTDMPNFDDIDEPYVDENYNAVYDAGERFPDLDGNGVRNEANGKYNGLACADSVVATGKCVKNTVQLYVNKEFIFSSIADSSVIYVEMWDSVNHKWIDAPTTLDVSTQHYYRFLPVNIAVTGNANPIPSGAQISVSTTNGGEIIAERPAEYVLPTQTGYSISQESDTYNLYKDDIAVKNNLVDISGKYDVNATRPFYIYFKVKPEATPNGKKDGTLTIKLSTTEGNSTIDGSISVSKDAHDNS